jgi:hypothetical protein
MQIRALSPLNPIPPSHLHPLRIDPAALVTKQRRDQRADVLRFADAAEGGLGGEHLHRLRIVGEAAAEVGEDGPRRDGVDADAARSELDGEVAGQHLEPTLHRGVDGVAGRRHARGRAGDVHDGPALGDERQEGLREEIRPLEMDIEEAVEIRLRGLLERRAAAHAGVVDETVDAAPPEGRREAPLQIGAEAGKVLDAADVEGQGHGLAAPALDRRDGVVGEHDAPAALGAGKGRRLADPAAGPGDEDDLHAACSGVAGVDLHPAARLTDPHDLETPKCSPLGRAIAFGA